MQDHTRRLRRAIERHAREHPLGEDYVMTTDADIITALAHKLEAETTQLRAENAALRAGQGTWPEHDDSPAGEQVPRAISAEELRSGASVATFTDCGTPVAGIVTGEATDKVTLRIRNDDLISLDTERRFVLLADAPVRIDIPSEQVRFKSMTDLRYKDPAPRLTVHALNTAPVGSVVSEANRHWTKTTISGKWFRVTRFGQAEKRTSEELLAAGYANATLSYPEGGRP